MPRSSRLANPPASRGEKLGKAVDELTRQKNEAMKEAEKPLNGCFSTIGAIALTVTAMVAFFLC